MQAAIQGQTNYLSYELDLNDSEVITLQFSKCGHTSITMTPKEQEQDCNRVVTFCIGDLCDFSAGIWTVELFHNNLSILKDSIKINYASTLSIGYS